MISTPRRIAALGSPTVSPGSPHVIARRELLGRIARIATMAAMVVVALLVAGVVGLSLYAYSHNGRIYEGVKVGDVPVGGMTGDLAEAAIPSPL